MSVHGQLPEKHLLFTAGIVLWFLAIRIPGQYFSVDPIAGKDHRVVRKGLYRVRLEESLLMERIGTAYSNYMKQTKRFIPKKH